MTPSTEMEKFGRLIISQLWNQPIEHHDLLVQGHWKAPALEELQANLSALSEEQKETVRRCVLEALNVGLHGFLFALQQAHDLQQGIDLLVDGVSAAEISDGLQGEPYGEGGWIAKYGTQPAVE